MRVFFMRYDGAIAGSGDFSFGIRLKNQPLGCPMSVLSWAARTRGPLTQGRKARFRRAGVPRRSCLVHRATAPPWFQHGGERFPRLEPSRAARANARAAYAFTIGPTISASQAGVPRRPEVFGPETTRLSDPHLLDPHSQPLGALLEGMLASLKNVAYPRSDLWIFEPSRLVGDFG